jgi:uncharacterized protein YhdP
LVTGIRPEKKLAASTRINYIRATIHSDSGYLHTIPYEKLYASVNYQRDVVRLEPIRFNAFGGRVEANMALDFFIRGWPAYKMDFSLNQVDAKDFFNFLEVKREFIEGDLDLSGNLSSKGSQKAVLIQNLSGHTRLTTTQGFLKNLPVHSKVFYVLNVSQLLQFRLPNLDREKMPYSRITGSFSFNNGVLSTQDLHTYTDNINMTVLGNMNLNNKQIDLTIGLQPFKTVETLFDIIPGSGWLLSGNGKKLLTVYFEAKGSWDNPKVKTLPVKYIPKQVFNIFRMAFGLP